MNRKIFRVEDKIGEGPYQGTYVRWDNHPHIQETNHPTPIQDPTLHEEVIRRGYGTLSFHIWNYKSGFSSLEQVRTWFHDERENKTLQEMGYRISEYTVPEELVLLGDTQVLIHRDALTRRPDAVHSIWKGEGNDTQPQAGGRAPAGSNPRSLQIQEVGEDLQGGPA